MKCVRCRTRTVGANTRAKLASPCLAR